MKRVLFAAALAGALGIAGAAMAAPGDELIGNTVVVKESNGSVGKWYANKDHSFAYIGEMKGNMVADSGKWHIAKGKLCMRGQQDKQDECWDYGPMAFGKAIPTKSNRGQTAQVTLVKGH